MGEPDGVDVRLYEILVFEIHSGGGDGAGYHIATIAEVALVVRAALSGECGY